MTMLIYGIEGGEGGTYETNVDLPDVNLADLRDALPTTETAIPGDVTLPQGARFEVTLFIGKGKYANGSADTREGIEAEAVRLKAENPTCKGEPVITAFDADGNAIGAATGKAPKATAKEKAKEKAEAAKAKAKAKADAEKAKAKAKADREKAKADAAKAKEKAKADAAKAKEKEKAAKAKAEKPARAPKAPKVAKAPKARLAAAAVEVKAPKEGSKLDLIVSMLKAEGGATVKQIMEKTGWLPHTTRAFLSATLRKKGYTVTHEQGEDGRVYKIEA